jgi:hypothetical protein
MMEDRFLKRLRKEARKGLRGWPIATVAFYGPNLSQATKVTVGIVPSENAEVEELRDWKVDDGEIRADPRIAQEILEFIEEHRVLSVAMTDGIIGCPHQEGIDYEGEWCPLCEFWHGRESLYGAAGPLEFFSVLPQVNDQSIAATSRRRRGDRVRPHLCGLQSRQCD